MALSKEEKEYRKEERRLIKWKETHQTINGINHKKCKACEKCFPSTTEHFYRKDNKVDGLDTNCKECTKKKALQWEYDNYDKWKQICLERSRSKEYKLKYKEKWKNRSENGLDIYAKKWRQNNPEKLKEYNEKRKQNKNHRITKSEWISCKEYFGNSCAYCGIHQEKHFRMWSGELKKIDLHKEHVAHTGTNDLSNCVPSCQSCNSTKNKKDFEEWYKEYEHFSQERLSRIHSWLNKDYKLYINKF